MEIHDLRVPKVRFQAGEVNIAHTVRGAGELFSVGQCRLFFFSEARIVALLECGPIVRRQAHTLRRSQMMLQAVMALVDQRHANVNQLIEFAVKRASHAGVEAQKILEHLGAVRQRLLDISRLAAEFLFVDLFDFGRGSFVFDQCDTGHEFLKGLGLDTTYDSPGPYNGLLALVKFRPEPPAMLSIRPATADDALLLKTLIHELAKYERLDHETIITEEDVLRDGFGPAPKFHALIAEWEGQPAGYALFFEFYSTFQGRAGIFLEDIYVRPELRKKGIGKELLAHVAKVAWDGDYFCLRWEVLDWNKPAIDFYKNLGATFLDEWKAVCLIGEALQAATSKTQ